MCSPNPIPLWCIKYKGLSQKKGYMWFKPVILACKTWQKKYFLATTEALSWFTHVMLVEFRDCSQSWLLLRDLWGNTRQGKRTNKHSLWLFLSAESTLCEKMSQEFKLWGLSEQTGERREREMRGESERDHTWVMICFIFPWICLFPLMAHRTWPDCFLRQNLHSMTGWIGG